MVEAESGVKSVLFKIQRIPLFSNSIATYRNSLSVKNHFAPFSFNSISNRLKSVVFDMPVWQILLLLAFAIILIGFFALQFLTLKVPGGTAILVSAFFIVLISLNGNSVMNEGGLDIASLLHFGI